MKQAWPWRKKTKIYESIVDKQLDYFKCKNKVKNDTQMNMVKTITSFTNVIMNMILQCDKGKQSLFPKWNYDEHNKEDA